MSLWGRISAAGYDRFLARTERECLGAIRRDILGGASGRVVEIGAGTGANLAHYPQSIDELVLTEPDEFMARRLEPKLAESGRGAEVVRAGADALPYPDDSFDTAVSTLVLCTVPDPAASLRELARVLRPGGRLLFVEHVRATDPKLAAWQDRLHRPWYWFGRGCNCNRPTLDTIAASPFEVERCERGEQRPAPPIVRPLVSGRAVAG